MSVTDLGYATFKIMNSELSKLTIKKDVQKNVSVSFDNCIESNRGSLWGNQVLSFSQKFITSHSQHPETTEIRENIQSTGIPSPSP